MKAFIVLGLVVFPILCFGKDVKVLYLGDSQSAGYLGRIVFDHLTKTHKAQDVDVYGISSSSPRHLGAPQASKNGGWICSRKGRHNTKFETPLGEQLCSGDRKNQL